MMNDTQRASAIAAFEEAIKAAKNQSNLAMILNCSQSRVSRILSGESDIEAEMAARIDIKFKVPKWRLRPDLFDAPKSAAVAVKAKRKRAGTRVAKSKSAH